jgi:hypothetical protein
MPSGRFEDFFVGSFLGLVVGLAIGLGHEVQLNVTLGPLDIISKLVPIGTLLVISAGAVIAYVKFKSDREAQQFANAVGFYRRYLELALSHTRYAEPDPPGLDEADNPEQYKEYEWFLGILFRACEELLEHSGSETTKWNITIISQLRYHKKYLRESVWLNQEGGLRSYSLELQELIDFVKSEPDI